MKLTFKARHNAASKSRDGIFMVKVAITARLLVSLSMVRAMVTGVARLHRSKIHANYHFDKEQKKKKLQKSYKKPQFFLSFFEDLDVDNIFLRQTR